MVIFAHLKKSFNPTSYLNKNFPENFELARVTPIFEKNDKIFVGNYGPVSASKNF